MPVRRSPTLMDYFGDFLMIVDESIYYAASGSACLAVTIAQAMLVEYGFRYRWAVNRTADVPEFDDPSGRFSSRQRPALRDEHQSHC